MASAKVQVNARIDPEIYDAALAHVRACEQSLSSFIEESMEAALTRLTKRAAAKEKAA